MNATSEFQIGDLVQIVNLDGEGQPGQYHGYTARIVRFFSHEGQAAAVVNISTDIGTAYDKKILLNKLIKYTRPPQYVPVETVPMPTKTPPPPPWAPEGALMVRGGHLQPGDVVRLSHYTSPRELQRRVSETQWTAVSLVEYRGYTKRFPGTFTIEPMKWYVVERQGS